QPMVQTVSQPVPQPQPAPQPLFQAAPAPEPVAQRHEYDAYGEQEAAALSAPQARPAYQAAQPRPAMYQPAPAPVRSEHARTTPVQEERPQREQARPASAFNGFNIFGKPKPAPRDEKWEARAEVNTRALTQTQPLFGDEFDEEIEIPTFLRKQAN
ncbi:MAG: hypothetical protein RLZZ157_1730, partial [Pseudomonadota bacterium]